MNQKRYEAIASPDHFIFRQEAFVGPDEAAVERGPVGGQRGQEKQRPEPIASGIASVGLQLAPWRRAINIAALSQAASKYIRRQMGPDFGQVTAARRYWWKGRRAAASTFKFGRYPCLTCFAARTVWFYG